MFQSGQSYAAPLSQLKMYVQYCPPFGFYYEQCKLGTPNLENYRPNVQSDVAGNGDSPKEVIFLPQHISVKFVFGSIKFKVVKLQFDAI